MGHISFQYNFPFTKSVSEWSCGVFMSAVAFVYVGGIIGIIVSGSSSFFFRHFWGISFEKPSPIAARNFMITVRIRIKTIRHV